MHGLTDLFSRSRALRLASILPLAAFSAGLPLRAQSPTPLPDGSMPLPVPSMTPVPLVMPPMVAAPAGATPTPLVMPTPLPGMTPVLPPMISGAPGAPSPVPMSLVPPTPSPTAKPTPLPDGSMPLPVPALPSATPIPDASSLSDQLNLPLPAPGQLSEPLKSTPETGSLKKSEDLALQQKMVMETFDKAIATLIAQERDPRVPDMTLDDAVKIALKYNPDLLNSVQQIRLVRGQLIQVVSQAVPQIKIASAYSNQANSLNPTATLPASEETTPIQNQAWNINFQGSQLIFDGGATVYGIKAGAAAYDSTFYSLRNTVDTLIANVKTQFFLVVQDRALIVAQQQNVELNQEQVKDQQNRYDAGTVPRFNVLQAEVALANAQPPLIQAQNNYRVALYQLVKLLGMDYPRGFPSEVPFNVIGSLEYNPRDIDTDESIRIAIARNPALKAQRQVVIQQANTVSAQIGNWFPSISATAGYNFTNNSVSSNVADTLSGWVFGATGTWNIWDGGLTYGKVAAAKAQMYQAKNTYDDTVRQVVLNVQQAISNLIEAKETIDSQTASVVQATEALRLARERLAAGAGTQLDVLNAQVGLLQAQTNVVQARYNYIAAMASYDQALSIDTQYVDMFRDPLEPAESRAFKKLNSSKYKQPALPHVFKGKDPAKPILEHPPGQTSSSGKGTKPAKIPPVNTHSD